MSRYSLTLCSSKLKGEKARHPMGFPLLIASHYLKRRGAKRQKEKGKRENFFLTQSGLLSYFLFSPPLYSSSIIYSFNPPTQSTPLQKTLKGSTDWVQCSIHFPPPFILSAGKGILQVQDIDAQKVGTLYKNKVQVYVTCHVAP